VIINYSDRLYLVPPSEARESYHGFDGKEKR
jgi:hypothetical protein